MSSRTTTPGHPNLRRWEVSLIRNKRYTDDGVIELQTVWESTTVRASQVFVEGDEVFVEIDGARIAGVRRHSPAGLDPESGEEAVLIEWKPSWRSVWEASGALDAIVEYHTRYPDDIRKKESAFSTNDLGVMVSAPEECGPGPDALNRDGIHLMPEKSKDYTLILASEFFDDLKGFASKASIRFLNMPVRQRVVFNDAYIDAVRESRKKGINLRQHLRTLLVYVTGLGRPHDACSRCQDSVGALPKCVIDDTAANGACVNCAMSGETTSCEFHHYNRRSSRPSVWNPNAVIREEGEEQTDEEDNVGGGNEAGDDDSATFVGDTNPRSSGLFMTPDGQAGGIASESSGHLQNANNSPGLAGIGGSPRGSPSAYGTPDTGGAGRQTAREEQPGNAETQQVKLEHSVHRQSPVPGASRPRRVKPKLSFARADWVGRHNPNDAVLVHNHRTFARAEASIQEVEDILSYCPCGQVEDFEEMYQLYLENQDSVTDDSSVMCKEECLATVWVEELNQAVRLYAPAPNQPRPEPMCIELD